MAYDISELRKENSELENKLERLKGDFDVMVRTIDWYMNEVEKRNKEIFSLKVEIEILQYKLKEERRNGKKI